MTLVQRVLALPIMIACLMTATGCEKQTVPAGSYQVEVEDVVEMNDLVIKKLTFTATGNRSLRIQLPSGSKDLVSFEQADSSSAATVTLVIAAEQFSVDGKATSRLRWSVKTKGCHLAGGSPGPIDIPPSKKLPEGFLLKLKPGSYPIGKQTDLAELYGKVYTLLIN